MQRNRQSLGQSPEAMPVYGTIGSRFNDDGVTALYQGIVAALVQSLVGAKRYSRTPASPFRVSESERVLSALSVRITVRYSKRRTSPTTR